MAKKKDTLKDLNEFMQKQSVSNEESDDFMNKKPTLLADVEKLKSDIDHLKELPEGSLHEEDLMALILKISEAAQLSPRHLLFRLAEKVLDQQKEKDHIDLLLENNIALLKHQQLLVEKLSS